MNDGHSRPAPGHRTRSFPCRRAAARPERPRRPPGSDTRCTETPGAGRHRASAPAPSGRCWRAIGCLAAAGTLAWHTSTRETCNRRARNDHPPRHTKPKPLRASLGTMVLIAGAGRPPVHPRRTSVACPPRPYLGDVGPATAGTTAVGAGGRQRASPASILEKPLARATFSARASWREPVEHTRVLAEHPRLHRCRQVRPLPQRPGRLREVAVPVRVVAGVEDEVRPERLGCERDTHLFRLAAHVKLPASHVLARVTLARGREPAALLDVLVQALEEVGHPADARLEQPDAQPRVALEDAAQHERRRRHHHVEGEAHAVDLEVVVEALRAELREVNTGRTVDAEGDVQLLGRVVEGLQVGMIEVPGLQCGRDHGGDEAERLRLAHDLDRRRDILDRDDGDALEPPPVRPAVAGEPAVVEAGELGRETRILDARQGERDVGEEHHRLDPLAIRVGEHALGRERVGAAVDAEALIGRAPGARTARLRVRPPLDHERAVLAGRAEPDLVGKALEELADQLAALDHMGVAVDDPHAQPPYGGNPPTLIPLVSPPSATIAAPVIADDSSLARKRATLAISAGRRLRPRACIAATSSSERPPKTASRSRAGVRTAPGQMQLARMFLRPYSSATERVRLIMPPLAVLDGLPRMPP